MHDKLKHLIDNKHAKTSIKHVLNGHEDIVLWINEKTCEYTDKTLAERVHIILHAPPNCKNMVFGRLGSPYKFCGNKKVCECKKQHYECNKSSITEKRKKTTLTKYGVEYNSQSQEIKDKKKRTNLERCGETTNLKTEQTKQKIKQTNLKKYGTEHPQQNDTIKQKTKQTNIERYGEQYTTFMNRDKFTNIMNEKYDVDHALQCNDIKDKAKSTNLERYGVEHATQSNTIKEKIRQTSLEKYGVDSYMKTDEFKEKSKQTHLKKYGEIHYKKTRKYKEHIEKVNMQKYNERYLFKTEHFKQRQKKLFFKNMSNRVVNKYTHLFDIDSYYGTTDVDNKSIKYKWKCNTCDTEFDDHINNGKMPRCPTCYPHNQSKWELELQEYISQYVDIETNTKQIINPYELDIYIPNKKFAIECNGSYWHSELNGKDSTYHLNKTELCEEQNIQLFHIWEHEYNNNPELIKSLIKTKLDLTGNIHARQTQLRIVDNKTKDLFLNDNCVQGTCGSKHNIGLYYENELVALMTFDKSRFDEKHEWELIRYCSKKYINVIGGASKLFKHFIKNYSPSNVISYADRRYPNGNMYKQLGFGFIENSSPNFKYTTDYKTMYNSVQFQKHQLEENLDVFDSTLTAEQNMLKTGYDRLWDCGNSVWIWKK